MNLTIHTNTVLWLQEYITQIMNVHVLTYIGNISKNIYISQILLNYIFFNAFICWLVVLPAVLHKYT